MNIRKAGRFLFKQGQLVGLTLIERAGKLVTTVKWSIPYIVASLLLLWQSLFWTSKEKEKSPFWLLSFAVTDNLFNLFFFFQVAYLKVFSQQGFKETIFPVFKGLWFHGCIITLKAELICYYYHNKYFVKQETLREKHRNGLLTSLHHSAYDSSFGTLIFTLCFDRAI